MVEAFSANCSDLHVILVDDHSDDKTATVATRGAEAIGQGAALTVIHGNPLPEGWTGKLWAVSQGLKEAQAFSPDYLLLTDADVEHGPLTLSTLVAKAEREQLALTSLMVRLHCRTVPEKMMIPAFVYFFFLLYPPRWISNPRSHAAGAAGGCMLIRPDALARAAVIESIRGEIIDDCALAKAIKGSGGRIWLGLADVSSSLRAYETFREIRKMIERTAFSQLKHSTLLLIGAVTAMLCVFELPFVLLLSRSPAAVVLATAAIALMVRSYLSIFPTTDCRRCGRWPYQQPPASMFGQRCNHLGTSGAATVVNGKAGRRIGDAQGFTEF
jgi:hopene-associated glycosyltransferase HpnB